MKDKKIITIQKNSKEECLKFELKIEKQKNKELQEQVSMLLHECNSMLTTVQHMPDLEEVIKCYKERDKLKKAIKILTDKGLGVNSERFGDTQKSEFYFLHFQCCDMESLTREEFDLLNEVLYERN